MVKLDLKDHYVRNALWFLVFRENKKNKKNKKNLMNMLDKLHFTQGFTQGTALSGRKCGNCIFRTALKKTNGEEAYKCRILKIRVDDDDCCSLHAINKKEAERRIEEYRLPKGIKIIIRRVIKS